MAGVHRVLTLVVARRCGAVGQTRVDDQNAALPGVHARKPVPQPLLGLAHGVEDRLDAEMPSSSEGSGGSPFLMAAR